MARAGADVRDFERLAANVKSMDKDLRKGLFRATARATRPMKDEIKAEARASLPSRGGLGAFVAKLGLRTRQAYRGASVGVTIVATSRNKTDLAGINDGVVHHPTYGRRPYVAQQVQPGFWDRAVKKTEPRAREEILDALAEAVRKSGTP